ALRRDGNRPEQAVGSDPRAVVVDLLQHIGRSNWTGINVQSDEAKGVVMVAAILADVFTLHETDVGLERERPRESRAHPGATNARIPDEAVEIGDLRGLREIGQWGPWWWEWKMVDQDAEGFNAPGDRLGRGVAVVSATPAALVERSLHQSRHQEPGT